MKSFKQMLPLLLVLVLLVSCGQNTVYTFEGLQWGSSPTEAADTLGLSLEDASVFAASKNALLKDTKELVGYSFANYDQNGFSGNLTLVFHEDHLCLVQLIAADADALAQKLTELYGTSEQNNWGDEQNGVSFHDGTAEWWNND